MEDIFKQTFDAVIIGEEYKQKIKKNLTEYQSGLAVAKNKNKNKRFHWNLQRIIIASSTAAVLMFCAIFIPLMAMNGGGGGTDMTATYKTQLLAAVSQLKVVDSYVERIETTMNIDGEELLITYTTSYQKSDSSYIADGYMESSNGTSQRYYVVNGYMYMPVIGSQYGGVKIHLEEEFISFVQFFSKYLGYLTPK